MNRLVFVNGSFVPQLSGLLACRRMCAYKVWLTPCKQDDQILRPHFSGLLALYREAFFVALNTAFMEDGAVVIIPQGGLVRRASAFDFRFDGQRTTGHLSIREI